MTLEGNSDPFLSLIEAHKGILYKVSHAYCRDPEDRKDLIQEITLQLWKSFTKYDNRFQHSTWIYRIALNVAISFYRKESTRKKISNPIPENIVQNIAQTDNPETETGIQLLHQFIAELKELDKALMLLYLEGKSYQEIADIIGITETNTATKISRIKTNLKQRFSQLSLS
jgi:RNA polymerase sigma factor (sigma-70 family)